MTTHLNEWAGAPPTTQDEGLVARAMRLYATLDLLADERAIYARLCEEAHIARQGGQRPRADELERAAATLRARLQEEPRP